MNINQTWKSTPEFRLSTFRNEDVLIFESFEHPPLLRILMVIICFIIGIATLIHLIIVYRRYKLLLRDTFFHRRLVPLILLLNIVLHVAHYADNIYDPVKYFEPKHLYLKIFISEMEQTFLFNIPLSILFLLATSNLLSSCTKEQSNARYMLIVVTAYCLMSMISGGHYTYEPPQNFSLLCNVTIAGETLVAFVLFLVSLFIHRSNTNKSMNHRYNQLSMDDLSDSNVKMSVVQPRQWKSKMSDDE